MPFFRSRTLYSIGTTAILLAIAACGSESDPDTDTGGAPPAAADGALVSTQEAEDIGTILAEW
jgi:hypothetical protein